MSIPKINGQQARELLDGDPGPLFVFAPELATTVAWLYGREPEAPNGMDVYVTAMGHVFEDSGMVWSSYLDDGFTPDEAVNLARALLAAAEEARRG